MTDAYRDDLEAALARVSDLEREVEALRERNAELEAGDCQTVEARENARRLAAALERERAELHRQHQREIDDAHWSQAAREEAEAARAAKAALAMRTTTAPVQRREVTTAEVMIGIVGMVGGGMAGLIAAIVNSEPIGAVALVMFLVGAAAVVGMMGRPRSV